jgi:hypothetical protein
LLEENFELWKDVFTLIKIESTHEINGKRSEETRYYTSDEIITNARYYNSLLRGY